MPHNNYSTLSSPDSYSHAIQSLSKLDWESCSADLAHSEIINALRPHHAGGDGYIWEARAESLLKGLLLALTELRDHHGVACSWETLSDGVLFFNYLVLSNNPDVSHKASQFMKDWLYCVPGSGFAGENTYHDEAIRHHSYSAIPIRKLCADVIAQCVES